MVIYHRNIYALKNSYMNNEIKMADVLGQLKHKKRTVKDLAQFIENKCDDNPNYTLLLGSGCSVTSGVNTGQKLISEWKADIYNAEHNDGESEQEFWNRQYSWYDERNPYSSLFEKKYDLPRQRRIFVEREIEGKTPSIGYAYLVKLIEKCNINTVFTTNFDDLLNEAFYRYSNVRPIVCAHDSSISSITVTSKRPKIIKLHGDYLFDDIKSTLRETESLNDNMKNKFIEFAKDHGLIVVGYAGNDRSIMDILNMLLQKEDYFKYGIYWCIRKGEVEISEELRKLLWKDRVYFVEIDGFDELMASLNDTLNKGELPIDDALLSSKRQKSLIEDMINSKYFDEKTNSDKIISRDIKKLSIIVKRHIIDDVFDVLNNSSATNENPHKKSSLRPLNEEEKARLNAIHHFILDDDFEKALQEIENERIDENQQSVYNFNLLSYKIDILRKKDDKDYIEKEISIFDKLVKLNPSREATYLEAYSKLGETKEALRYLDAAIKEFPNDYTLYNQKIKFIFRNQIDSVTSTEDNVFNELKECIDKSIGLLNSPTNEAWVHLCRYYQIYYYNDREKAKVKINEVIDKNVHISTSNLALAYQWFYKTIGFSDTECIAKLKDLLEFAEKSDDWSFYEDVVLALLKVYDGLDKKEEMKGLMQQYETQFKPSDNYLYVKASYLKNSLGQYTDSLALINSNLYKSRKWKELLLGYYCDIRDKGNASKVLDKYFKNDLEKQLTFHGTFNNDDEVIRIVNLYSKGHGLDLQFISSKACSLIRLERYDEAYIFCKKYFDQVYMQREGVICINYYLAYSLAKHKTDFKEKLKKKMIDGPMRYEDAELAAAYSLLDDKQKCFTILKKVVEKNPLMKFDIKEWPVFDKYKNDSAFQSIVDTSNMVLM